MLKWTPSRYTMRQCVWRGRSRQASNCWVSVWLRRLIVLALGATPSNVWATSPTLWVLVPATNIPVASLGNVRFIAAVAFKGLRVELTGAVSGHVDLLEPTRGGHQIAGVVAVAVPFALGATLAPGRSNKLVELFTHHGFYHDPHSALGERTQVVMEDLLVW